MAGAGALPGYYYDPISRGYKPTASNPTSSISGNGYPDGSVTPVGDANVAGSNKTAAQQSAATGADYSVTQNGGTDYTNQTSQQKGLDASRAKLQADAEARRLAALSASFGGDSALLPKVGGANVASDENAARAAAFGRAKDQAGQIARSAMTSIDENVASRGIAGSGIEALQKAGAIQDASAPLQDLTREQYIQDLNRSADISDETYTGNITQRGQDVSQKNSQKASLLALINQAFSPALY